MSVGFILTYSGFFQLSHEPVCSVTFEGYLQLKSNRLDSEETASFDETLLKFFEYALRIYLSKKTPWERK